MRCAALLAWLLVTAACDGADEADEAADAGSEPDAADAAPPVHIVLPATDGELAVDFTAAVTGRGSRRVGAISAGGETPTLAIGGRELAMVVDERIDWTAQTGYTLLQFLAVDSGVWYPGWFYCRGGMLEFVWVEGTDGLALAWETATGTCTHAEISTSVPVHLPAVDMEVTTESGVFTVTGPQIELAGGGSSWVELGSERLTLLPFEYVDCGDCGGAGWHEIHALLWDPEAARACFAIFYLYNDDPTVVDVTYSLTLPDLSDPAGHTTLPATWSRP